MSAVGTVSQNFTECLAQGPHCAVDIGITWGLLTIGRFKTEPQTNEVMGFGKLPRSFRCSAKFVNHRSRSSPCFYDTEIQKIRGHCCKFLQLASGRAGTSPFFPCFDFIFSFSHSHSWPPFRDDVDIILLSLEMFPQILQSPLSFHS